MSVPIKNRKFSAPQMVMVGVILASFLAIGVSTVRVNSAQASFDVAYQENNTKIAGLRAEIEKLVTVTEEPDEIQQTIYSAVQAGTKVANLQTEFQACHRAPDVNAALDENISALMEYMDMSGGAGYTPWFITDKNSDTNQVTWRFATNYEFTQKTMSVLWLCTDSDGELVAFTTGIYNADTGKFSNIVYDATSYGTTKYHKAELNDTAGLEDDVDYTHASTVDIPDGYSLDASGNLVDANGNAYVAPAGSEDDVVEWAGEFSDDFSDEFSQAVKDRADAVGGGN